jgi:hypothetical protein
MQVDRMDTCRISEGKPIRKAFSRIVKLLSENNIKMNIRRIEWTIMD